MSPSSFRGLPATETQNGSPCTHPGLLGNTRGCLLPRATPCREREGCTASEHGATVTRSLSLLLGFLSSGSGPAPWAAALLAPKDCILLPARALFSWQGLSQQAQKASCPRDWGSWGAAGWLQGGLDRKADGPKWREKSHQDIDVTRGEMLVEDTSPHGAWFLLCHWAGLTLESEGW